MSPVDAALMGVDTDDPVAVETALEGLDADSVSDEQAVLLLRMRSMAAEKLGREDEALTLLDTAAERAPDDPDLHLHRGIVLEARGRVEDAVAAFVRAGAEGTETDAERLLAAARYLYLWDRPGKGLQVLQPLFRTLRDLGRGDDEALAARGLPTLTLLLAHYALFARMSGQAERVEDFVGWVAASLEGPSVESACGLALAFARDDADAYGEWLTDWTGAGEEGEIPSPARRVAWALHRARHSEPLGAALRHLEAVQLGADAPSWLKDLLAFGRAETFHRHDMERDEAPWRERVLRAQPMLFEPEHVVRFGLFGYQERLKEAYRASRAA